MSAVLRYVAGTKKSPKGTLYLQCHIKPGASKIREGVTAVTDDAIEICVSAQPRDGESNKAVLGVLCKASISPASGLGHCAMPAVLLTDAAGSRCAQV